MEIFNRLKVVMDAHPFLNLNDVFAEYPLQTVILIVIATVSCVLFALAAVKGRTGSMLGILLATTSILIFICVGADTEQHAFRSILLADELRYWNANLILNLEVGPVPIFYYYSTVIYTFAALLMQVGLSAMHAINFIAVLSFLLLAVGFLRLAIIAIGPGVEKRDSAYLVGMVFLTINYVYLNYIFRGAISEALSNAFVPIIVVAIINRKHITSTLLISFQIMIHPVVFIQSFIAEAALLLMFNTIFRNMLLEIVKITLMYMTAVFISTPFWFPGLFNRSAIVGIQGLPVKFEDTFLKLVSLVDPHATTGLGLWFPLLFVLVLCVSNRHVTWRVTAGLLVLGATILLQLQITRPWVTTLPIINLSLFVFRWMFVSAILGTTILALLWTPRIRLPALILVSFAAINTIVLSTFYTIHSGVRFFETNAEIRAYHNQYSGVWGTSEFLPNYSSLPKDCIDRNNSTPLTFTQLQMGPVTLGVPAIIPNAPIGIVTYVRDGDIVRDMVSCNDELIIPIFHSGSILDVRGDIFIRHPWFKILLPVATLLAIIAISFGRVISCRVCSDLKGNLQSG